MSTVRAKVISELHCIFPDTVSDVIYDYADSLLKRFDSSVFALDDELPPFRTFLVFECNAHVEGFHFSVRKGIDWDERTPAGELFEPNDVQEYSPFPDHRIEFVTQSKNRININVDNESFFGYFAPHILCNEDGTLWSCYWINDYFNIDNEEGVRQKAQAFLKSIQTRRYGTKKKRKNDSIRVLKRRKK